MAVEGVDYAWNRPSPGALKAAGKVFACRYGGPGSIGKQLDAAEAAALNAEGIAIVANAEGAADGMLGGWNTGVAWAKDAEAHFKACGMPADRPIYFSADFDVEMGSQWTAVANALKGAASVIGLDRVGIYGGRWPIQWARSNGVAKWFWQTYAWSSGVWVPGNHIEQYKNGVTIGGTGSIDLNRALTVDYGQWKVGGQGMFSNQELEQIVNAVWGLYLAPGGYNMKDHLLNTENFAVKGSNNTDLIRVELAAIRKALEELAASGGSPDTAVILAGVNKMLADQLSKIEMVVDTELDEQSRAGADVD